MQTRFTLHYVTQPGIGSRQGISCCIVFVSIEIQTDEALCDSGEADGGMREQYVDTRAEVNP